MPSSLDHLRTDFATSSPKLSNRIYFSPTYSVSVMWMSEASKQWLSPSSLQQLPKSESELNSAPQEAQQDVQSKLGSGSKFNKVAASMSEMLIEPVDDEIDCATTWEYHTVDLSRVPGYGFGIAVSGGKDNPHFKSGEPSIVISDVLRAGPAWSFLQVNDRIISANSIGLESADYSTAVQIMKENEHLNLIIKRRVPLPALEYEQRTLKFTLTKSKKKDDFGIQLGCKFFIKDITNRRLADKEPGLKEGDVVLKINGQNCEDMPLTDAKRLLERSREKLSLIVQRDVPRGAAWRWPSQSTLYERLGTETPSSYHQSPRASPAPLNGHPQIRNSVEGSSSSGGHEGRMASQPQSAARSSGRAASYGGRMVSSEYNPSSSTRNSYTNQISSGSNRSRTPSHSLYEDYPMTFKNQRNSASRTPPPPVMLQNGGPSSATLAMVASNIAANAQSLYSSDRSDYAHQHAPVSPTGGPVSHKPPLPVSLPEPRFVSFKKEGGSVGVRVVGGNEVGIFVSAVQGGSPAAMQGVRSGDKILRVNTRDMREMTREDAVIHLLSIPEHVDLILQYRREEYERVRQHNLGDNFYIRTHFAHEHPENQQEMAFGKGEIFQVIDTLHNGTVGSWQVIRVAGSSENTNSKGVVPNSTRAEQIASTQRGADGAGGTSSHGSTLSELGMKTTTLLRRKLTKNSDNYASGTSTVSRRSKSLTKGLWDELVFQGGAPQMPAYERVRLRQPDFLRPIVIYGALADVAREQLLRDFPLRFANAQLESDAPASADSKNASGVVRLSSIREVMTKNKHCVLEIAPASVERLAYAQFAPIVLFVNVDSRTRLRELRRRYSKQAASRNCKKLLEQANKLQKHCSHLFTAVLDASQQDRWFDALRDLVSHLQERRVWMSESRPTDLLDDDFLFPMTQNCSSSSNYVDSDADSLKGEISSDITSPLHHSAYGGLPPPKMYHQQQQQQATVPPNNVLRDRSPTPYDRLQPSMVNSIPMQGSLQDNDTSVQVVTSSANHPSVALRRSATERSRVKPTPPPRLSSCPAVPPKPKPTPTLAISSLETGTESIDGTRTTENVPYASTNAPAGRSMETSSRLSATSTSTITPPSYAFSTNNNHVARQPVNSRFPLSLPPVSDNSAVPAAFTNNNLTINGVYSPNSKSPYQPPPPISPYHLDQRPNTPGRQNSTGYYDVKQILAEQSEQFSPSSADYVQSPYGRRAPPPPYNLQGNNVDPAGALLRQRSLDTGQPVRSPFVPHNGPMNNNNNPQMMAYSPGHTVQSPAFRFGGVPTPTAGMQQYPDASHGKMTYQGRVPPSPTHAPPPPAPGFDYSNRPPQQQQPQSHERLKPSSFPLTVPPEPGAPDAKNVPKSSPIPFADSYTTPIENQQTSSSSTSGIMSDMSQKTTLSSEEDSSGKETASVSPFKPALPARVKQSVSESSASSDPRPLVPPPLPLKPPKIDKHQQLKKSQQSDGSRMSDSLTNELETEPLQLVNSNDEVVLPENHTVLAEVKGEFDSDGGVLSSPETGVSIIIPPGALPVAPTKQEMYFKVCRDDSMVPPLDANKGERLLSPLVMCGPQGLKFLKPVQLMLPHNAASDSQKWTLALKSTSAGESGKTEWRNLNLNETETAQSNEESTVSVMIDCF